MFDAVHLQSQMSQNKGVNREGISVDFFDKIFNWFKYGTIKSFNQVKK